MSDKKFLTWLTVFMFPVVALMGAVFYRDAKVFVPNITATPVSSTTPKVYPTYILTDAPYRPDSATSDREDACRTYYVNNGGVDFVQAEFCGESVALVVKQDNHSPTIAGTPVPTQVQPTATTPPPAKTDEPTVTRTPKPDVTSTPKPTKEPTEVTPNPTKDHCDKGEGNGGEDCDPGNNPDNGNNDEDDKHNGKKGNEDCRPNKNH